ncbi:MAG: ATP-grasp domain-containing protein [Armatimonadota bacterium]|nr:ATP-grasp domain-containing protein [Armatimonadota bacterium]
MGHERTRELTYRQTLVVVTLPFPENVPTGLGVIRALGQQGVPVIAAGARANCLSMRSRYVSDVFVDDRLAYDGEAFAAALRSLGARVSPKPVLFVSTDFQAAAVSNAADALRELYIYPYVEPERLTVALDKRRTCEVAKKAGISAPATVVAGPDSDVTAIIEEIRFSAVVRPAAWVEFEGGSVALHKVFREVFSGKAVRATDHRELERHLQTAADLATPIIVQEEIVGPSSRIFGASSYSDEDCDVRALFVGRKTRQLPSDFGSGTMVESMACEAVADHTKRLVEAAGYHGVAELEFKFDERDQEFKIIEINPRPGTWISVAPASGVNTPYVAYADLQGHSIPPVDQTGDGMKWIDAWPDLEYLYKYRSGDHAGERLSVGEYLRSVRGRRVWAYWDVRDPVPSLVRLGVVFRELSGRAIRKLVQPTSRKGAGGTFAGTRAGRLPALHSGVGDTERR